MAAACAYLNSGHAAVILRSLTAGRYRRLCLAGDSIAKLRIRECATATQETGKQYLNTSLSSLPSTEKADYGESVTLINPSRTCSITPTIPPLTPQFRMETAIDAGTSRLSYLDNNPAFTETHDYSWLDLPALDEATLPDVTRTELDDVFSESHEMADTLQTLFPTSITVSESSQPYPYPRFTDVTEEPVTSNTDLERDELLMEPSASLSTNAAVMEPTTSVGIDIPKKPRYVLFLSY
jgi:hypothetical protein